MRTQPSRRHTPATAAVANRCTRSTCPPTATTPDTVRGWAEEARQALAAHGGSATELAEALDLQPSVAAEIYERIRRKLDAEADRGSAHRLRGRLRHPARRRRGCRDGRRRAGPRGVDRGRRRRAIPRNPGEEFRGTDAPTRGPHFAAVRAHAGRGGRPDRRLRHHAPEGDLGRAGRRIRVRAWEAGEDMLARARHAAFRDPGGDSRRRSWPPTVLRSSHA